jgi:hypothetical protein
VWLHSIFQIAAATVVGEVLLAFWTFLVEVATSTPKTTMWLPTVVPDVAKLLTVKTLHKAIPDPVGFHPNHNVV